MLKLKRKKSLKLYLLLRSDFELNYDKTESVKIGYRKLKDKNTSIIENIYVMIHVIITEGKSPEIKFEGIYQGNIKLKRYKGIEFD